MFRLMKQVLQLIICQFNFNKEKVRKSEVICTWIYALQKLNNKNRNNRSIWVKIEVNRHKNIYNLK